MQAFSSFSEWRLLFIVVNIFVVHYCVGTFLILGGLSFGPHKLSYLPLVLKLHPMHQRIKEAESRALEQLSPSRFTIITIARLHIPGHHPRPQNLSKAPQLTPKHIKIWVTLMTSLCTFKQTSSSFTISQFVFLKSVFGAKMFDSSPGFLIHNLPSIREPLIKGNHAGLQRGGRWRRCDLWKLSCLVLGSITGKLHFELPRFLPSAQPSSGTELPSCLWSP